MARGARFAIALILFWLAFVCFYVAFHPGGVVMPGADPDIPAGQPDHYSVDADGMPYSGTGPKFHKARNPAEVLKFIISQISAGPTPAGANG